MLCDVRLIFLGDNNFGVLKYKQRIQSLITPPAIQDTEEKMNQNSTMADPAEADTSSGTVVGILSDDLNSGTFVSLPKLPAAVKIEAAKCLLALKSEVNIARPPHESTSSPITKYPPANPKQMSLSLMQLHQNIQVTKKHYNPKKAWTLQYEIMNY